MYSYANEKWPFHEKSDTRSQYFHSLLSVSLPKSFSGAVIRLLRLSTFIHSTWLLRFIPSIKFSKSYLLWLIVAFSSFLRWCRVHISFPVATSFDAKWSILKTKESYDQNYIGAMGISMSKVKSLPLLSSCFSTLIVKSAFTISHVVIIHKPGEQWLYFSLKQKVLKAENYTFNSTFSHLHHQA